MFNVLALFSEVEPIEMSSYWTSFFSSIFPPQNEEEVVRRENARVDHLIAEKKLRIKHLKKKVKARKEKRRKEHKEFKTEKQTTGRDTAE